MEIKIDDDYGAQPESNTGCCGCLKKGKNKTKGVKEITRELYPKEWNVKDESEEDIMA